MQRGTGGQNTSESRRKFGRAGPREENRVNEKKSLGKSMYSQDAQAGVHRMPLHVEDAEMIEQGEDMNVGPEVPEAEVVVVGYEPRFPA